MSILSALKQQNSSIDDLAKLPQAMIMQMAQKKQISQDMLAPILSRKAEMMDAVSRSKALQQPAPQLSVMEQIMAKNIEAENPANTVPAQPQAMPQAPQEAGVAQLPIPERQYAGGGIVAFAKGDLIDEDDEIDVFDDYARATSAARQSNAMPAFMASDAQESARNMPTQNAGVGLRYTEQKGGSEGIRNEIPDADQARKYNVGNLRPSGFTYPGQIGVSKGKFAMFDSPESGLAALQHDIGIKLNRGLDTPEKFISVYAPAGDKNDVKAYSKNVAKMLGISPNEKIPNTPEAKQLLANAIIRQEGAHKATAAFDNGGEVQYFTEGGQSLAGGGEVDSNGVERFQAGGSKEPRENPTEFEADLDIFGNYLKRKNEKFQESIANLNPIPALRDYFKKPISKDADAQIGGFYGGTAAKPVAIAPASTVPPVIEGPGLTADEMIAGSSRSGTFDEVNKDTTSGIPIVSAPKEAVPKTAFEMFMEQNDLDRAALGKQRKEDQNMALLAAGLGMLGGGSQYAFENIGKGGLSGVQYLSEANKQRAAEKAALDKNRVAAAHYENIGKYYNSQTLSKEDKLKLQERQLSESIESKAERNILELNKNIEAQAIKNVKEMKGIDELTDPAKLAQLQRNEIARLKAENQPLFDKLYKKAGLEMPTLSSPTSALQAQADAILKGN